MTTTTTTILFTGTITTVEPLAYSPPDHCGPDKVSRVPRMAVPSAAGPMDSVYLSGSAIRGALRHACADVWLEREKPVTHERFLQCKVGGVKGTGKEPLVGLSARATYLEADPLLDLFGAGGSKIGWIHSRLDVGAGLPDEPVRPIHINGARRDATADSILLEMLGPAECDAVVEGRDANRRRSAAASDVRDLTARLKRAKKAREDTGELERALEAARHTEKEAAGVQSKLLGSDVSLRQPLAGYEAIPPGTVLPHRMLFKAVSQRQMALFMGGLARFAADPRFGARRAQGCGRVRVDYEVKRLEGTRASPIGTVSIDAGRWDSDGDSLAVSGAPERWLGAWREGAQ